MCNLARGLQDLRGNYRARHKVFYDQASLSQDRKGNYWACHEPQNEAAGEWKVRGPFRLHRLATRCPGSLFVGTESERSGEAQDGSRHLAFETGARIELSGSAVRTAHSSGSPVCPQSPELTPGGYGARRTAESLVRTRLSLSYRAEESRARLWPPETTGGGKSERQLPGPEAENKIGGAP
ncbi:hypothetical protein NDU88_004339 [Pleurodeles waltl]|uniref:Uncharacterized protein n=1 Tax=Pleurodeles waltl TaxID=8319 RepID=A0AAV7NTF4_PLEWA|nr:hypothetical protein NDU88_004339 [Pleurodeles waltl]